MSKADFTRDIFVLCRKRTAPFSLWVELGVMSAFLLGSNRKYNGKIHWVLINIFLVEVYVYSPDWITPPHSNPSFYIASSLSIFFDLLLEPIAVLDMLLTIFFLALFRKKSARRRANPSSDAPPSSNLFGCKRTWDDIRNLFDEIKEYAFEHSVFRKKK